MLVATLVTGQNIDLHEIKVTAPQFRSEIFQNVNDFLLSGIEYPFESVKAGNEGTEVISFTVTPNGDITDIKVINSVSSVIDLEVIRVLEFTSGMWIPGTANGQQVAMEKEISIMFKISDNSDFEVKAKNFLRYGNEMLFIKKQPKKALKYFDESIKLLPNEETLLAVRGLCRYEIGDISGAKDDWHRLKTLSHKNTSKSLPEMDVNYSKLAGYYSMKSIVAL